MDFSTYQQLSGVTVASGQTAFVQAQIDRTQAMLETMLGFTLNPENVTTNLYNELGKTQSECSCPNVDTEVLNDPDVVVGSYRLYKYNELDRYFHVDPFSVLNKVKLVYIRPGDSTDNPQGVTIKTMDVDDIRVEYGREGWAKYIERCRDCLCYCDCKECVQVAVDADWLWTSIDDIPKDLLYVWTDMITYYSDPKRNIKSESITTHSYTKSEVKLPELEPHNLSVIKKYAGQYGSVVAMPL